MNVTELQAKRLAEIFRSDAPSYYVADFKNAVRDAKTGKVKPEYVHRPKPVNEKDFLAHLQGTLGLVIVPVGASGLCRFGAIDIDKYPLDLMALLRKVTELRLPLRIVRTKSGGAHLYYFGQPRSASDLRLLLAKWSRLLGYEGVEIFPKQDLLLPTDNGSPINLPYFGSFPNAEVGQDGDFTLDQFLDHAEMLQAQSVADEEVERAAELLRPLWTQRRHDLTLAMAGALFGNGVQRERVDTLIDRVVALTGDEEPQERRKCVTEAARAIAKNKKMYGIPMLKELLGPEATDRLLVAFDIEEAAETAYELVPPRTALNWTALEGQVPPEREWVMTYWLPDGHVTLLSGKGGIGKTLLAQHIGTSVVLGREYIAQVPKPRKTLMWAAEDDDAELWRRQLVINSLFEKPITDLDGKFFLQSYAGRDVTLALPVYGALQTTPMMKELREQVHDYGAEFVIIDNSARVFGGNENDRHAVTTFIAWLQQACAPAAVLLLSHPAKADASEYSGSTAWEGAVRTRLFMTDRDPDDSEDDEEEKKGQRSSRPQEDPAERYLCRRKANYAPQDVRTFTLDKNGLLTLVDNPFDTVVRQLTETDMQQIIIQAVMKLADMNMHGTASTASKSYLPKLARQYRFMGGLTEGQFVTTMRQMLVTRRIVQGPVGRYSNGTKRVGLMVAPKPTTTNEGHK
jgi:hypothetical protein